MIAAPETGVWGAGTLHRPRAHRYLQSPVVGPTGENFRKQKDDKKSFEEEKCVHVVIIRRRSVHPSWLLTGLPEST